jgi:hypothetical protein
MDRFPSMLHFSYNLPQESFSPTTVRPHISGGVESKAIPSQAWSGPEVSRRLRLSAHEGGKVVSPAHRPPPVA